MVSRRCNVMSGGFQMAHESVMKVSDRAREVLYN